VNNDQRRVCQHVVETFAVVEPLERSIRRTDWTLLAGGISTVAIFGYLGYGLTGWWATLCVVSVALVGFIFGGAAERIASRRRTFSALKDAHEEASLELALDDGK
jgi:hypothetical protein